MLFGSQGLAFDTLNKHKFMQQQKKGRRKKKL